MLKWANPVYHIILMMSQNLSHGFIHTTLLQWVIVDFSLSSGITASEGDGVICDTADIVGSHYAEVVAYFMSFADIV